MNNDSTPEAAPKKRFRLQKVEERIAPRRFRIEKLEQRLAPSQASGGYSDFGGSRGWGHSKHVLSY